jgi:hypothetical protein
LARFLSILILLVAALALPAASSSRVASGPHCGDLVTTDVVLTENLVCSGDGLFVQALSTMPVTLDLNGHSIVGSGGGMGVNILASVADVSVKNGSITGFSTGVISDGTAGDKTITMDHLRIHNNVVGVGIINANFSFNETTISNSTITKNQTDGVSIDQLCPSHLINDTIRENGGDGIAAATDSLSLLQDSLIARNGGDGAFLNSTVATISGNTFLGNSGTGLSIIENECGSVQFYLVSNNVARENYTGGMSMFVAPSPDCVPLPQPPPGDGNVARNNSVFQCVLIVCAENRGLGDRK